jgi:hypothetical protein
MQLSMLQSANRREQFFDFATEGYHKQFKKGFGNMAGESAFLGERAIDRRVCPSCMKDPSKNLEKHLGKR